MMQQQQKNLQNVQRTNESHSSRTNTIRLILIRHGIAMHNIIDHHDPHRNATDETYLFDPPLTSHGKIQAVMIGETIRQLFCGQQQTAEYRVLTSPLTRCLQTAMYAFGIPHDYGDSVTPIATTNTTVMTPSIAIATIHCHESLREACGIYNCDRRRTKTQLQNHWGHAVQFVHQNYPGSTFLSSDHDTLWHPTNRETIYELQCRISQFITWFLSSFVGDVDINETQQQRQQQKYGNKNIIYVLVTHGVWIETMLQMYNPTWSNSATGVPPRVQNADIYATECHYRATTSGTSTPPHHIQLLNVQKIPTLHAPP